MVPTSAIYRAPPFYRAQHSYLSARGAQLPHENTTATATATATAAATGERGKRAHRTCLTAILQWYLNVVERVIVSR